MTNPLSIPPKGEQNQVGSELTVAIDRGIISEPQQRAISTAVNAAHGLMLSGAIQAGEGRERLRRHATYVDHLMVQIDGADGAMNRARESLIAAADAWQEARPRFHSFKRKFYQMRRKQVEAKQLEARFHEETDPDKKELMEADWHLLRAEIEELESDLAAGEAEIKRHMEQAAAAGEAYEAALIETGKEHLTKEDFDRQEVRYQLMAAWWHVSNNFHMVTASPSATRKMHDALRRNPNASQMDILNIQEDTAVHLKEDAYQFLAALGIGRPTAQAAVKALMAQKQGFDMVNEQAPQSFHEQYRSWLRRMADEHLETAMAQAHKVGFERLRQIGAQLKNDFEEFEPPGEAIDRPGVTR